MALLTLKPGCWYALQQISPAQSSLSWEAATPVLVANVKPLRAGGRTIELELVRAFAELGPSSERVCLRVIYRSADVIIAIGNGWHLKPMTVAITTVTMEWLGRFCPRLLKRYEPFDHYLYGVDEGPTAEAYLAHHLGQSPRALTDERRVPGNESFGTMPAEHGTVRFARSYAGLDAWLLLRPVIPPDMDFKWLIVGVSKPYGAFALRFYRSWTGILIYEVPFKYTGTALESTEALINLDESQYGFSSPETETALLGWLIDYWLLGRTVSEAPRPGDQCRHYARDRWADHFCSQGQLPPCWLLKLPMNILKDS